MSAVTNNRLAQLGVPVAYRPGVAARRAPRFHTVIHFTIILASLVAATAAMAGWSHYIDATAEESAGRCMLSSTIAISVLNPLVSF